MEWQLTVRYKDGNHVTGGYANLEQVTNRITEYKDSATIHLIESFEIKVFL